MQRGWARRMRALRKEIASRTGHGPSVSKQTTKARSYQLSYNHEKLSHC